MLRPRDEERVRERLNIVRRELQKKMLELYDDNLAAAEKHYANIFVHKSLAELNTVMAEWPLAKFVRTRMYDVARHSGPVPLDANEVWKIFRKSFLDDCDWYAVEIERRLLSVKRELRAEVLKECSGDLLKQEKYYAELLASPRFEDLDEVKNDWPLARLIMTRMNDIAKSDPYPLVVEKVWHIFRTTFLGRNNLLEAEVIARRLLWRMALELEEASVSPEKEQADVAHIASLHNLESLSESANRHNLSSNILDELWQNTRFSGKKNENPSMITAEAWYRFRRLLTRYRSQIYSTTP